MTIMTFITFNEAITPHTSRLPKGWSWPGKRLLFFGSDGAWFGDPRIVFDKFLGVERLPILLMAEILHQLIGSLSHYLQGFIHPRWCRISAINSRKGFNSICNWASLPILQMVVSLYPVENIRLQLTACT